ncbi:MAG TPA: Smr/MutS family protein [Pyrinomonadaceae bacterium]
MSIFNWLKNTKRDSTDNEVELDFDPDNPFPDPIEIEITDVFDLHTIQPREVKVVVEEYLQQAHAKGFKSVRIIHGKGIGVQREIVRSVLAATPFVVDWTDAPADAGGWGATIVRFRLQ